MTLIRARIVGLLLILALGGLFLTGCDEDDAEKAKKDEAQRQSQLQQQLAAEKAQRLHAEQVARYAQKSRSNWIFGIGGGACIGCVVVGLIGVGIGSRALERFKKEHGHG